MVSYYSHWFHSFNWLKLGFFLIITWLVNACAPQPPIPSPGHINTSNIPPPKDDIPPLVEQRPFVPPPQPVPPLETYTVVVDNVPVDKLLFALARDAGLDVDIYPGITGAVTLNAINQTLPQLLERIAKQVSLRYQIDGTHLTVAPDLPYMRLYKIGYVNMLRDSKSEVAVATQIVGSGIVINSAGNNSTMNITNQSNNRFWETLEKNIRGILGGSINSKKNVLETKYNAQGEVVSTQNTQVTEAEIAKDIIINPESGVINVLATHKQHEEIQNFLDQVLMNVQRQVLIEATIVEVQLSDQYQAGVDWQRIHGDFTYTQSLLAGNLGEAPFYSIGYSNPNSQFGNISSTVKLLEQFGTVKVLSSPKIMALNNQPAVLKVVDNIVYFTTTVDTNQTETQTRERITTVINTVPVGLVMMVTPQIGDNDVVTLNVRPTVSRIVDYKSDPNPALAQAGTISQIPSIQIREIESVLKINNGDVAIIGGLMQDVTDQRKKGIPWLSQLPLVGDLFSYRDEKYTKTELVIFLKPIVVKEASLSGDLKDYQIYLPNPSQP
jgi:general secretion pathway protein D